MYQVNDLFYTLQGEGHWSGRPAVFCRFSRCNLWSGVERERAVAICTFCDTDFNSFQELNCDRLVEEIVSRWPGAGNPMVVFTGGEPLLQLDSDLVQELHGLGWYVAVETNGTLPLTVSVDWVCVSPKTKAVRIRKGDELKFVYPQKNIQPDMFSGLDFDYFWISPMNESGTSGNFVDCNTVEAVKYVLENPAWRLNVQMHKMIGVK